MSRSGDRAGGSGANESDTRIVFVTAPDDGIAERIGRAIVEENLAACVNLLPRVRSIYRWQGVVEEASEILMLVKTTAMRVDALRARIVELHPYEVPEFLAVDVTSGFKPYLDWIRESTM